jgi:hypothetical protein
MQGNVLVLGLGESYLKTQHGAVERPVAQQPQPTRIGGDVASNLAAAIS